MRSRLTAIQYMGKRKRTLITAPSLFFATTTVRDWRPVFTRERLDALERQLFALFPAHADTLMGYVLMPSHVHLLVGCRGGGVQLSKFMGSFKSLTTRQIFPNAGPTWMHRFDDVVITSEKPLSIKLNYIHENPVRAGLVQDVIDWKWSSARFWSTDEVHSVLAKDWDWLSSEDA